MVLEDDNVRVGYLLCLDRRQERSRVSVDGLVAIRVRVGKPVGADDWSGDGQKRQKSEDGTLHDEEAGMSCKRIECKTEKKEAMMAVWQER